MIELYKGNCLEVMKELPDKSIDMILCDLPYGVLNKNNPNAQWDKLIPFDKLWFEYENMVILDNCMGSGTTGVACKKLNRNFIGIEIDENYYNIARNRIKEA